MSRSVVEVWVEEEPLEAASSDAMNPISERWIDDGVETSSDDMR